MAADNLHDHVSGIAAATHADRRSPREISSEPHCHHGQSPRAISFKPHRQHRQSNFLCPVNVFSKRNKADSIFKRMNRLGKKADVFARGVQEHVRLSKTISETVKGKMSLGARILQVGGMEKVFRHLFAVTEGERLRKASQCYLSTTAGPIAGLLFISTEKVAFCSERSLKASCPDGETIRIHYKVSIPLSKIEKVNQSENVERPSRKYVQILTVDNFDFWFIGFLNHQKALKDLQQAVFRA